VHGFAALDSLQALNVLICDGMLAIVSTIRTRVEPGVRQTFAAIPKKRACLNLFSTTCAAGDVLFQDRIFQALVTLFLITQFPENRNECRFSGFDANNLVSKAITGLLLATRTR